MTKENKFTVEQQYEEMADSLEDILFRMSPDLDCNIELLQQGIALNDWDDVWIASMQIMEFARAQNSLRDFSKWRENKKIKEQQIVDTLKKEIIN
jgi:urease gamma subunit